MLKMKLTMLGAVLLMFGLASFAGATIPSDVERVWIGPEYWANPMEDWKIKDGRMECLSSASNRNVHFLTKELNSSNKSFSMSVDAGLLELGKTRGSVGFRVAIKDEMNDYRSQLFNGYGIDAGITTDGLLYLQDKTKQLKRIPNLKSIRLKLKGELLDQKITLTLSISDIETNRQIGTIRSVPISSERIRGNIAIVNNHYLGKLKYANVYRNKNLKGPRFWFKNWFVEGEKISTHADRTFGPILWSMYSLSRNVMKMTAMMPPIGKQDHQTVRLDIQKDGGWHSLGDAPIAPDSRTATFRITEWDDTKDTPYRLVYNLKLKHGESRNCYWNGTIRKDPKEKETLVVAGFTGQTDYGFPHSELIKNVGIHNPDLLFFSGDQIYEHVGGYGIIRRPADRSILNYLRKYYMFGMAYGDLMRDRPTLCLPDDHDVFQGNVWGNGGNAISMKDHDGGGYAQPAEMVNVVHKTHADHHPDAYDPTPIKQNISVYYGDMVYGNISFAIVADRMFKSGPKYTVADWKGRADHVTNMNYDMKKLDQPGLVLMGERQLDFMSEWGKDWVGADMKCVLSQTVFTNVATHHGGGLKTVLYADLDSNGWPQTGRNKALDLMRKSFAIHLAGDQHLPTLLQHGIDEWRDSVWSFSVPAVAVGYQRAWWPDKLGMPVQNRDERNMPNTGDYLDCLGNKISVHAVGNPEDELCKETRICTLHDKASGYGIVRFHKPSREITFESWRLLFDAENPQPEDQFTGWPKTVSMYDNYAREPYGWLPDIIVTGMIDPVVQVVNEKTNEVIYTVRILGSTYSPRVFEEGTYKVIVGDQLEYSKIIKGLQPTKSQGSETIEVDFSQ